MFYNMPFIYIVTVSTILLGYTYREAALRAPAPLFSGGRGNYAPREKYPFVFDSMEEARQSSAFIGGVKVITRDLHCS
jgi:hypothetical protein